MKAIFIKAIVVVSLFSALSADARVKLALQRGTMSLGGSLSMEIRAPKGGPTTVGLEVSPAWNYFLTRNLSFLLEPTIKKNSLGQDTSWYLGFGAGLRYHVDLGGAIYPYFGAEGAVGTHTTMSKTIFALKAPLGVLVPFNSQVALNLGVPFEVRFTSDGYHGLLVPVGYLGISAFF